MKKFYFFLILITLTEIINAQSSSVFQLKVFDKLNINKPLESSYQSFVYYDTTHLYDFKFKYLDGESSITSDSTFYSVWIYSHGFILTYKINTEYEINNALRLIYKRLDKPIDLFLTIDSAYVNRKVIKQPEIIGTKYVLIIPCTDRRIYFETISELRNSIKKNNYPSDIFTNENKPVFIIKYKTKTAPNTRYK